MKTSPNKVDVVPTLFVKVETKREYKNNVKNITKKVNSNLQMNELSQTAMTWRKLWHSYSIHWRKGLQHHVPEPDCPHGILDKESQTLHMLQSINSDLSKSNKRSKTSSDVKHKTSKTNLRLIGKDMSILVHKKRVFKRKRAWPIPALSLKRPMTMQNVPSTMQAHTAICKTCLVLCRHTHTGQ